MARLPFRMPGAGPERNPDEWRAQRRKHSSECTDGPSGDRGGRPVVGGGPRAVARTPGGPGRRPTVAGSHRSGPAGRAPRVWKHPRRGRNPPDGPLGGPSAAPNVCAANRTVRMRIPVFHRNGWVLPVHRVRWAELSRGSSTARSRLRSSAQVNHLWTCAQQLSTGCGELRARQPVHRVFHRPSTGMGELSPGFPQPCPQFGNIESLVSPGCERRHVMLIRTGG